MQFGKFKRNFNAMELSRQGMQTIIMHYWTKMFILWRKTNTLLKLFKEAETEIVAIHFCNFQLPISPSEIRALKYNFPVIDRGVKLVCRCERRSQVYGA
jgi:hypothetical protein